MKRLGLAIFLALMVVGLWALLDYLIGEHSDLWLIFSVAIVSGYLNGEDETPEAA